MKKMNKVIAAMMIMVITTTMPAMAGNKKHTNHDKKATVVVVTNGKTTVSTSRQTSHFDAHKHGYRPDVKSCTFRVSRRDSHLKVVSKAENMRGVMDTKWNPRTREVTVIYDAKVTSARHIKHFMA